MNLCGTSQMWTESKEYWWIKQQRHHWCPSRTVWGHMDVLGDHLCPLIPWINCLSPCVWQEIAFLMPIPPLPDSDPGVLLWGLNNLRGAHACRSCLLVSGATWTTLDDSIFCQICKHSERAENQSIYRNCPNFGETLGQGFAMVEGLLLYIEMNIWAEMLSLNTSPWSHWC